MIIKCEIEHTDVTACLDTANSLCTCVLLMWLLNIQSAGRVTKCTLTNLLPWKPKVKERFCRQSWSPFGAQRKWKCKHLKFHETWVNSICHEDCET